MTQKLYILLECSHQFEGTFSNPFAASFDLAKIERLKASQEAWVVQQDILMAEVYRVVAETSENKPKFDHGALTTTKEQIAAAWNAYEQQVQEWGEAVLRPLIEDVYFRLKRPMLVWDLTAVMFAESSSNLSYRIEEDVIFLT